MREFKIEEKLKKELAKLSKKDRGLYDSAQKKFMEIISCEDVSHYKNLRKPLQGFKRVHVRGSFVLIFKYIPSKDQVVFYALEHHDSAYK